MPNQATDPATQLAAQGEQATGSNIDYYELGKNAFENGGRRQPPIEVMISDGDKLPSSFTNAKAWASGFTNASLASTR